MDKNNSDHTSLTSDFFKWQIKNPEKINWNGESVTEDGRLVLNLSIKDTKFRLLCPFNYPNHEDSFFMETECTDFWCIALNEFITDSPQKLYLDIILAKIFLYYTPCYKKSYDNSENESENECEYENESCCQFNEFANDVDEWESIIICKKKREWRKKEGELRLRYNRPKISDMFDGNRMIDHPQQVFSNTAASEILINDLINIIVSKDANGIIVDPIENDICRWSVLLRDFYPHSNLNISNDLKVMKEFYGYDYIQLELDFIMDLYPSHPPIMRFTRPKLVGVFNGGDFVKLDNWNPARDMMSVLKEIKDYIYRNGRIDVNDKIINGIRIDIIQKILIELRDTLDKGEKELDPSLMKGENIAVEMILTRFLFYLKNRDGEKEYSQEKSIRFNNMERDSHSTFLLASNNNIFHEKSCKEKSFIENDEKLETQNCYKNYQKVDIPQDKRHCNIITNPAFGLESEARDSTDLEMEKYFVSNISVHETNGASIYGSGDRNNKCNSDRSEQRNKSNIQYNNDSVVSSFNANIETLKGLSLTSTNNCNSALELNENLSCVLKIIEESVLLKFIRSKVATDTFSIVSFSASLYSKIIEIIIELARNPYLINLLATFDIADQSIADILKIQENNMKLILEMLGDIVADDNRHLMKQADLDKAELAKSVIDASKFLELQLTKYCDKKCSEKVFTVESISNLQIPDSGSNCKYHEIKSLDSIYKDSLKGLKFSNCIIDVETHTFKNDYIAEINSSRNYFRIAEEFALLSKSLPLELSSSIFVRIDYSKPSLMRALITGAEGTFYSGGCFSFDIYLRKDYPDNDGLEMSCTTFRNEGGIAGHFNDSHDPKSPLKISDILQVLTFIQNQRLIPPRVYGEFGKENRKLEESGCEEILLPNVIQFAMIDQMRNPIPGFEEVIETHFRIKKDQILSELEKYDFLKNSELLDSLKKEFDRL